MTAQPVDVHSSKGLCIVQLATGDRDILQYKSSSEAINERLLEIRETSEAGSVNQLLVLNLSSEHVFLMDGDILLGAKQNRVVNTSIMLAPNSKVTIPVSCVEQGRWNSVSGTFTGAAYTAPSSLRAEKTQQVRMNLRGQRGHIADQGAVWDRVSEVNKKTGAKSATGSLTAAFDIRSEGQAAHEKEFVCQDGANGLAVFIGNQLSSLDLFHRTSIYREYYPKLVRSAILEMSTRPGVRAEMQAAEAKFRSLDFLDAVEEVAMEEFPGVAVGREFRFDVGDLHGCALRLEAITVHLCASRLAKRGGKK
jgi:hypothetical protein